MKHFGIGLCLLAAALCLLSCESKDQRQAREANEGIAEMNRRVDQFKRDGEYIRRVEADPDISRDDKDKLQRERIEIMKQEQGK